MKESKEVQIISLSKNDIIEVSKKMFEIPFSHLGVLPKPSGRGVIVSLPDSSKEKTAIYSKIAYYKVIKKVLSDIEKQIEHIMIPIKELSEEHEIEIDGKYNIVFNTNTKNMADLGSLFYDLEVKQNIDIYQNGVYNKIKEGLTQNGFKISKTKLFELLSSKGFNDDYISLNLKNYLENGIRETLSLDYPLILGGLDVNQKYNIIYKDFLKYDNSQKNGEYNVNELLEFYTEILSIEKEYRGIVKKIEDTYKKNYLDEDESTNRYIKLIENKSEVINLIEDIFHTKNGEKKFIIHHLMDKFNLNYDEIKYFYNNRSSGRIIILNTQSKEYEKETTSMKITEIS